MANVPIDNITKLQNLAFDPSTNSFNVTVIGGGSTADVYWTLDPSGILYNIAGTELIFDALNTQVVFNDDGFSYAGDYSPNFNPLSLINKAYAQELDDIVLAYVDGSIAAIDDSINDLRNYNTIQDASISQNASDISNIQFPQAWNGLSKIDSSIGLGGDIIQNTTIALNNNDLIIDGSSFKYSDDFSADFTDRSIIDKEYVDNVIANIDVSVGVGSLGLSRSTNFTPSTTFSNISFDTVDVSTDSSVVNHNDTNPERINFIQGGTYYMSAIIQVTGTLSQSYEARLLLNDITPVPGADVLIDIYTGETHVIPINVLVTVNNGDYITLQGLAEGAGGTFLSDITITANKIDGVKGLDGKDGSTGATGTPGSGTSINVQKDGINLAGPFDTINFAGDNITLTEDSSTVDVQVDDNVFGKEFQTTSSLASSSTTSTNPETKVGMTTTSLPSGNYKLTVSWVWNHSPANNDAIFDVTQNGSPIGTSTPMNMEPKDSNSYWPNVRIFYLNLAGTQQFDLRYYNEGGTTTISDAVIELHRVN